MYLLSFVTIVFQFIQGNVGWVFLLNNKIGQTLDNHSKRYHRNGSLEIYQLVNC